LARTLRREFADRILPVGDAVTLEWGRLAALRPRGDADGLIAATAIVHNLVLVTRKDGGFRGHARFAHQPVAAGVSPAAGPRLRGWRLEVRMRATPSRCRRR
jgi:predicted nucleic acid-binding protein